MNPSKISVLMPIYNASAFVEEAIESVLAQTYNNWELIVVNDGSPDDSVEKAARFKDSRIKIFSIKNQGPSGAFNFAFSKSEGAYIALFSGDDVCAKDRLEKQLAYRQNLKNPSVIFSAIRIIDQNSHPRLEHCWATPLFKGDPLDPCSNFERLVLKGNFLNAPSAFLDRGIIEEQINESGFFFNPLLMQLQDFDFWLRITKKSIPFEKLNEELIFYRIRDNLENLSAPSPEKLNRCDNEGNFISKTIFEGISDQFFKQSFHSYLLDPDYSGEVAAKFEQANILLRTEYKHYEQDALERIFELLLDDENRRMLKEKYNFSKSDFFKLTGQRYIFHQKAVEQDQSVELYCYDKSVDKKDAEVRKSKFVLGCGLQTVDFILPKEVRPLALDLVFNVSRYCRFKILSVECKMAGEQGQSVFLDLNLMSTNGLLLKTGFYDFFTFEPEFHFELAGKKEQAIEKIIVTFDAEKIDLNLPQESFLTHMQFTPQTLGSILRVKKEGEDVGKKAEPIYQLDSLPSNAFYPLQMKKKQFEDNLMTLFFDFGEGYSSKYCKHMHYSLNRTHLFFRQSVFFMGKKAKKVRIDPIEFYYLSLKIVDLTFVSHDALERTLVLSREDSNASAYDMNVFYFDETTDPQIYVTVPEDATEIIFSAEIQKIQKTSVVKVKKEQPIVPIEQEQIMLKHFSIRWCFRVLLKKCMIKFKLLKDIKI